MVMIHCRECGKKIADTAPTCPFCGAKQITNNTGTTKTVNWSMALIFSIFLGFLGIDRFYMGQTGYGIIKLLTFGGFGIWWFIDIILIATKQIKDVEWEV